jgi:hypothetical protein
MFGIGVSVEKIRPLRYFGACFLCAWWGRIFLVIHRICVIVGFIHIVRNRRCLVCGGTWVVLHNHGILFIMCIVFRGSWGILRDMLLHTFCDWQNGVCANIDVRCSLLVTAFDSICPRISFIDCVSTPWLFFAWAYAYLVALFIVSEACLSLVWYKSAVTFNLHVWWNVFPYANVN